MLCAHLMRYRFLAGLLFLLAAPAFAQVDMVDPDVKPSANKPKTKRRLDEVYGDDRGGQGATKGPSQPIDLKPGESPDIAEPPAEDDARPAPAPEKTDKKDAKKAPEKKPDAAAAAAADAAAKAKPAVAPIAVTKRSDADLDAAWERWRAANANTASDPAAEARARAELLKLKTETGARDIEPWAIALLRAAEAHEAQGSSATAIELAISAVELAPDLPAPQFGLARAYFHADPSEIPRYFGTVKNGIVKLLADPRYLRPAIADIVAVLGLALAFTTSGNAPATSPAATSSASHEASFEAVKTPMLP